jgi:UDP-glucose 6-dehydrogenase
MKKILIIGAGKVGTATNMQIGNVADFHDPYKGIVNDNFNSYEYIIVCVDTIQSGPEDYKDLESVLDEIDKHSYSGIVAIRSTVSPQKVMEWDARINFDYILFPEFLKQSSASELIVDHAWIALLGGSKELTEKFAKDVLIDNSYPAPLDSYRYVSKEESAITKLAENAALASKVVFFNSIYKICQDFDTSYENVRDALGLDPRIGLSHSIVPSPDDGRFGFGGHCLPKDILSIAELDSLGHFNDIIRVNSDLGR